MPGNTAESARGAHGPGRETPRKSRGEAGGTPRRRVVLRGSRTEPGPGPGRGLVTSAGRNVCWRHKGQTLYIVFLLFVHDYVLCDKINRFCTKINFCCCSFTVATGA